MLARRSWMYYYLQGRVSHGHCAWGQWRRKRCRRARKFRWSQHLEQCPCCSQKQWSWPHLPACCSRASWTPSPAQPHISHPNTAPPCTPPPLSATPSSPETARTSPPDLYAHLKKNTTTATTKTDKNHNIRMNKRDGFYFFGDLGVPEMPAVQ